MRKRAGAGADFREAVESVADVFSALGVNGAAPMYDAVSGVRGAANGETMLTLWIALAFFGSAIPAIAEETPTSISLCELLRNLDKFHGRTVTVRGVFRILPEYPGLYSEDCQNITNRYGSWFAALAIRGPEGAGADKQTASESAAAFMASVMASVRDHDGKTPRSIRISATGVINRLSEYPVLSDQSGKNHRLGFGHLNKFPARMTLLRVEIENTSGTRR